MFFDKKNHRFLCEGSWTLLHIDKLKEQFKQLVLPVNQKLIINGSALTQFDSAGALALQQCIEALKQQKNEVILTDFKSQQKDLLELIEDKKDLLSYTPPIPENILFI